MESSAQVIKDWLKCFLPCPSFAEEHVKLAMKQQEHAENTVERVKDKERPVGEAVEARMRDVQKHKPKEKLFPDSPLFKQLGEDLSEAQQKKAQDLFQKLGYNCYLGNQLPLSRVIPDTWDAR